MILPLVFIVVLIAILYTHFKQKPETVYELWRYYVICIDNFNQVTSSASTLTTVVTDDRSDKGKTYLSFLVDKNIVNPPNQLHLHLPL